MNKNHIILYNPDFYLPFNGHHLGSCNSDYALGFIGVAYRNMRNELHAGARAP